MTKIFIPADYISPTNTNIRQTVYPYGEGIVIDPEELAPAIIGKKILPTVLTDQNVRVLE